eukprot:TRINITY_DN146_c1_g3_i2.p1 TRINITY_DN146_c1_g3~~TRINITY_DN146_c1_g3_i2.p1  ORF type:complete len:571 (-),score=165.44 TRINITY_DN146_c1_g3_i2:765-2477(-)
MGTEQQFCLKWNNHRSTILSVFDNLLEEESLVDVTLTAEGQFLRAHKLILSACSPYFRIMFRAANEKHPVIYMQNVDFENLKALVEYMYRGEANVPQHMLPSFIRTAESLQIRGLAEGAGNHTQYETGGNAEGSILPPPSHASTPAIKNEVKKEKRGQISPPPQTPHNSGILAARLAKMADHPNPIFNNLAARGLAAHLPVPHLVAGLGNTTGGGNKKRRTLDKDLSPIKQNKMTPSSKLVKGHNNPLLQTSMPSSAAPLHMLGGSFIEGDEEGDLKIDEDAGGEKENRASPANNSKTGGDEDITDLEANGVESEEEEPSMPAPGSTDIAPGGIINPWTGEDMSSVISEEHEDNNSNNPSQRSGSSSDTGLVGWSGLLGGGGEFSESGLSPFAANSLSAANPPPPSSNSPAPPNRLKRFTNNDSVFTMCQTSDGPKFRCTACSRVFNLKCTLLRHVRHQHQGRFVPHPCSQCGQVFKRTDHLKVHMKKIHNIAPISRNRSSNNGSTGSTPSSPSGTSGSILEQPQIDYEEPRDLSSASSRLRDEDESTPTPPHQFVPSPLLINTPQTEAH